MKALIGSLVVVLLAGCSALGPGSPSLSPSPTVPPAAAATPSQPPTNPPTPSPTDPPSTPSPTPTDDETLPVPPGALLSADGVQHAARTGSYCYREACSDAPFWPTAVSMSRIELSASAAELAVALADGGQFTWWRANYAARDDHFAEDVMPLAEGGAPEGEVAFDEALFAPPPPGEWLLQVNIHLAGGEGSINYYWFVAVP